MGNWVPDYLIAFTRSARQELEAIESSLVKRIFAKIINLSKNPRPPGCRKIKEAENLWRLRVGDYRVIYSFNESDKLVDIIAIRHRSKAYEGLNK